MEKKIRYTDEPIGEVKVVQDFLLSPEKLAFREDTVKVTMVLNKTSCQAMIRNLLDLYARHHRDESAVR